MTNNKDITYKTVNLSILKSSIKFELKKIFDILNDEQRYKYCGKPVIELACKSIDNYIELMYNSFEGKIKEITTKSNIVLEEEENNVNNKIRCPFCNSINLKLLSSESLLSTYKSSYFCNDCKGIGYLYKEKN